MATGDHPAPAGTENITASPPQAPAAPATAVQGNEPEQSAAPALAPKPPIAPESLFRRVGLLETLLLVLVLVFAFLVASFPASNSDLLLSLATGRLIATGGHQFGSDPFTFTAQGQWINHHWLFDLVVFSLWRLSAVGGIVLVVLKALAVALLGWLMVQTGSLPGRPRWLPLSCSVLALLAASRVFYLQPIVGSFLLLAITLFLLVRVGATSRWIWLLPLLCGLWVNLDEWFFLGPLSIALFLVGEFLQRRLGDAAAEQGGSLKTLALVFAASVLACLFSPYHIAGLRLPMVLDPTIVGSETAEVFRGYFMSPLEGRWFQARFGLSPAGLAWIPLAVLGMASFALTFPSGKPEDKSIGWRWWRVLLWLVFLGLAAWSVRGIPFFAIVAAPITALNFLDFSARQYGQTIPLTRPWRRWAIGGRLLTILVVILLGAASVPGLLQAEPHYQRRLGWGFEFSRDLEDGARRVAQWKQDGLLTGEEKWVNLSPDAVHYFAWFCADEDGRPLARFFFDQRLRLFRSLVKDISTAQKALAGLDTTVRKPGEAPPTPAWRDVLYRHGVQFFVYHSDLGPHGSAPAVLGRTYENPKEWQACFAEGKTALFAWRDPDRASSPPFDKRRAADFDKEAFGPDVLPAPAGRPTSTGEVSRWRELLEPRPASVDADTAAQHLIRFAGLSREFSERHWQQGQAIMATRVIGAAAGRWGPFANGALLQVRLDLSLLQTVPRNLKDLPPIDQFSIGWLFRYRDVQDQGPVSSLYLAVRAARRAIHDNPTDPRPYLSLAEAYIRLTNHTRERGRGQYLPRVLMIRQAQIAAALQTVLALGPPAHLALRAHGLLWENLPAVFVEPRVKHLREQLRLLKDVTEQSTGSSAYIREQLDALETGLKKEERDLKNRRDQFEVNAVRKPLLEKVMLALKYGLPETALNLLLKAETKDLEDKRLPGERPGATYIVDLLLKLGRIDEARQVLNPPGDGEKALDKRLFGAQPVTPAERARASAPIRNYEWYSLLLAAASGDYQTAEKVIDESIEMIPESLNARGELSLLLGLKPAKGEERPLTLGEVAGLLLGERMLSEARGATHQPELVRSRLGVYQRGTETIVLMIHHRADLLTLRAWLALEQGRIDRAREDATKALAWSELWTPGKWRAYLHFGSRGIAVLCLELIDKGRSAAK